MIGSRLDPPRFEVDELPQPGALAQAGFFSNGLGRLAGGRRP